MKEACLQTEEHDEACVMERKEKERKWPPGHEKDSGRNEAEAALPVAVVN